MEEKEYHLMYAKEENHWWFKGKRKIISDQISKFLRNEKKMRILDIGCGTGILSKELQKYGDVVKTDISYTALKLSNKRSPQNLLQSDIMSIPFRNNSFDAVAVFDVLYHKGVTNDAKALAEAYRVLKPGGFFFITDSADMNLKSSHDVATHVRERYTIKKIRERLQKTGFAISRISYYNMFLFPVIYFARKIESIADSGKPAASDIKDVHPTLNFLLYLIFSLESHLLRIFNFPFGASIFAVARKP